MIKSCNIIGKKIGLSQKEVAKALNIPATTYRDWEYGVSITGEPYSKLACLFQVSILELLGERNTTNQELMTALDVLEKHIKTIRKIAITI